MEETNNEIDELDRGISDKDIEKLQPEDVEVVDVEVIDVNLNNDKGRKAVLIVKHSERDDPIRISAVQFHREDKVVTNGTWISIDEESKFLKKSALAVLLTFYQVETLRELIGHTLSTVLDSKGFLVVKAYQTNINFLALGDKSHPFN